MERKDYIATDNAIKKAYTDILKSQKRMPTQSEVAKIVGVTRATVNTHLNKIDLSTLVQPYKLFGNEVLMGLSKKASEGDTQAAKLFFMLIYDWSEKQKIEHEGEVKVEHSVKIEDTIKKYKGVIDDLEQSD